MATTTSFTMNGKVGVPIIKYSFQYSSKLARSIDYLPEGYATEKPGESDFYDALKVAAVMGANLPTAQEEQVLYAKRTAGAKKLQNVEEFRDHFANNIWGHSSTCLRFRKADLGKQYNAGYKVTVSVIETDITPCVSQIADPKFTRNDWKDIIDKVNRVKSELAVPYARGHVIKEMHPDLGIFTEIELKTNHKPPYALHGWLRENLDIPLDPISGHYDVALERRNKKHGDKCLSVVACFVRWDGHSANGFRPVVRVYGPEGPDIESDFFAQVALDVRTLPIPEILEIYT